MPRNQERSAASVPGPVARVPVQIYMDPEDWAKLSELARMDDRSRSWLVRDLIHRALADFEADGRVAA